MRIAYIFCLAIFLAPTKCFSQDPFFFWSGAPQGFGAQPEAVFYNTELGSSEIAPVDIYLYYVPFADVDEFDLEFTFPHCEIIEAEVYNFPIFLGGTAEVGQRWDSIGDVRINGNTVSGFSASSSSSFGGLNQSNLGPVFFDQGGDFTASPDPAFLIGRVRLKAVQTDIEYVSTLVSNDSADVAVNFNNFRITPEGCVLDPPFGGFDHSHLLSLEFPATGGSYHCTTEVLFLCDGTVWNYFEPVSNGLFTCNTFGSAVTDTVLEIYAGQTEEDLELIATNDDVDRTLKSRVSFPVEQGQKYSIRIVSDPIETKSTRLAYEFLEGATPGDINGDNAVNLLDVAPFVETISSGIYVPEADTNFDGNADLLDVNPFVAILSGK